MDEMIVMAYIFGMVGVLALLRVEQLNKEIKKRGILAENCKEE